MATTDVDGTDTQFLSAIGSDIITVFVGPKRCKFSIHKKLICSVSQFFDRAMNGSFQEAATSEVYLQDDEPKYFDILVQRLYRGVLSTPMLVDEISGDLPHSMSYPLFHYYLLVDKLLLPDKFKVEALDSYLNIRLRHGGSLVEGHFLRVLDNIVESDPIHKIILDQVACELILSRTNEERVEGYLVNLSEFQKQRLIPTLVTMSTRQAVATANRQISGPNDFCRLMNMSDFRSVASISRYQVGFLSETKKKKPHGRRVTNSGA
ncbi:MAG: hypothetical protein Q9227_004907 [Pyrenula ochraceoflavens]